MIFLNELKENRIYTRKCMLPIYEKDKLRNSLIMLLSPNIQSSINQINDRIFLNRYFYSYYIERDINIFITDDNKPIEESAKEINSSTLPLLESKLEKTNLNYQKYENCINVMNDDSILEAEGDNLLYRLLYKERLRTPKEIIKIYNKIKADCPEIRYTFLYPERYKNKNLFLDFYYYNKSFFENNNLQKDKGLNSYLQLLQRFINDKRFDTYKQKYVMVPVNHWKQMVGEKNLHIYSETINPISILYRLIKMDYNRIVEAFGDTTFIFTGNMRYMKINFKNMDKSMLQKFLKNINILISDDPVDNNDEENNPNIESKQFIKINIIDKLEKGLKIKINNLTGTDNATEKEIIERIEKATVNSNTTEDAMDVLDEDDDFKQLLLQISSEGNKSSISETRRKRLDSVNNEFLQKKVNNIKVQDILKDKDDKIRATKLNLDTVNEEWDEVSFPNFEESFELEKEIVNTLMSFNDKTQPVAVLDLQIEDKSTSEDLVDLYTIKFEDANGKRFSVKLDIPKYKDGKFMVLKGNTKKISGQFFLKPITKSDRDTVQIVSNYNKIFIRRFGQKSDIISDRMVKTFKKNPKDVTVTIGDNRVINMKYVIPYDYEYMCGLYNKLESKSYIIYFNQEEIRNKYDIDESKGLPFAYDKKNKQVIYVPEGSTFSGITHSLLSDDAKEFNEIYQTTSIGKKYMYSRASILNADIPLIIVCAYNEGLTQIMNKAKIEYEFHETKPRYNPHEYDTIRFEDGYIVYKLTPASSLFMNGLKDCGTERYSLGDINSREMYLDILDKYGSRVILSDGLENFYDLMIDPKTREVLEILNLPTKYTDVLIYANGLLADTSYIRHTDMNAYRYRTSEIVSACIYSALANAYIDYKKDLKHGKKDAVMSVKQNAVINELLLLPTTSDFSIINALYELEAINEVSYKGKVGMNSDRAYDLAKRSYDKTMINNVAMSTNFAGNVGINRQMTVNANILNKYGFMNTQHDESEMGINTFCATELMTPFGALHSDPMRTAMTFIQKAKHQLRTSVSHPNLITTGMDDAMPYMLSNTFVYKSREDGKVLELSEDYMVIEYKDKSKDMVRLDKRMVKNSDGGFYGELQLVTDLKEGQAFKKDEILAHDPQSFSRSAGHTNNLTYSAGILIKMAKIYTDESFEDSTIISDWLSYAGSSDMVLKKDINFDKNVEVLSMVNKGDPIQEGDTLILFQEGFEDEDVKKLLSKLSDDSGAVDELGRRKVKSKVTGWVDDIKIYRTVDIEELSPSLQKIVNKYESGIRKTKNVCKKYGIDKINELEPDYKLEPTGKLKNTYNGVLIEFYLKYKDDLSVGDKIVFYDALKGVVRDKFPIGKEPYTSFRPDEKIHAFLGLSSCQGRMVNSVDIVIALNKGIIELTRQCKEILNIPVKYIDQM